MNNCTLWHRVLKNKEGSTRIEFNHLEFGLSELDKPQPIKKEFVLQNDWVNYTWVREYAFMDNNIVKESV